jgi:phage replication O-like protein O
MDKRIYLPNTTQTPNDILDKHMKELSGSEFKVIMAILRKTLGWHKWADYISISQIMEATGLSNRQSINCVNSLEKKGFIRTKKSKRTTTLITINFTDPSEKSSQGSEKSSQATGEKSSHTKPNNKPINIKPSKYVDLWNECNGTKLRITDGKRNQIKARLKKFTELEIESAIKARGSTKWVKENNHQNNWDALFRSDDALEHWLLRSNEQSPEKDAWAEKGFSPAIL